MLRKILLSVAFVLIAFVVVVAVQPSEFRVARTVVIAAPAPAVFAHVNDLRKWEAWSPWAKLDPAMKKTYEGPAAGVGASYAWSGNNEVGEGRSTIVESRPGERVRLKLEFARPFEGTNTAELTFKPEGERTAVTWTLAGTNNFVGKAVGLVMNMDAMVGGQFEQGLGQLKAVVETAQKQ